MLLELAQIRRLDYFDKFIGNYAEGESKRSAISKLNLFLEEIGFKANEAKGEAKLLDIKERCNQFCKQFKEIGEKDPQDCEELLYSYFAKLKQKHKEGKLDAGTIKNRKSTIKNLLKKTKIPIDWDEVFKGLPKPKRYTNDSAYSIDEILKICEYNDKRIKPIVYTMVSSGMRLGAWDYLKWSHITPITNDGKVICALIELYYGTNEQYPTLITKEAYMELTKWKEFRRKSGEEVKDDSWVMRHYWDTKNGFTHGSISKPEQLKSYGVKSLLDSALRRQGLRKNLSQGKTRHEVKLAHGFRKFHETQLIKANLKQVDVNILQGHANDGMVDHYYRPSMNPDNRIDDYLINEFLKAERFLIIDEKQKENDELRKELDKKYDDVKKELQIDTNKQIEDLKDEMDFQRLIMVKASEIIDRKNKKILENPKVLTGVQEIDDIKNKHYGNQHIKAEEEDIMPFVKNDISDDENMILLANELLKIDNLEIGGNVYTRKQIIEQIKERLGLDKLKLRANSI